MRPETKVVLDEIDKRIIEQLQQDGRRPYTQIAPAWACRRLPCANGCSASSTPA